MMFEMPPPPPDVIAPVQINNACVAGAAGSYGIPPELIVAVRIMEGGKVGHYTVNKNKTIDIGPLQINSSNVPFFARYGITANQLLNDECVNLYSGTYFIRYEVNRGGGDIWRGVGRYHSPTPSLAAPYVRSVWGLVSRLYKSYGPYVRWLRTSAEQARKLAGAPAAAPTKASEGGGATVVRGDTNG